MVFSSPTFLFAFLPLTLAAVWLAPRRLENVVLLGVSLLFYAWGEQVYTLLMLASILFNYVFGLCVDSARGAARRATLAVAIAANLSVLCWFKYAAFAAESLGLEGSGIDLASIHLPVGISFFTFHAISYVVDVYRRRCPVQRDPVRLALYVALFPQLIAGPIVRYGEIAHQLSERSIDLEGFAEGVRRFIVGLAKKVLIANVVAVPADQIFGLPHNAVDTEIVWFGAICFALQIYFDFSAYSDMAVGLGRMLGFRFPENFDLPYSARSITEFWRRWHMSLSRWFRDYLYIPLGGSRGGRARTYANLVTVFLLCGLWHGASWSFVAWGAFHGAFLVLERAGLGRWLEHAPRVLGHLYCLVVVLVSWVIFRAETLADSLFLLQVAVGLGPEPVTPSMLAEFSTPEIVLLMCVGIAASADWRGVLARLRARLPRLGEWSTHAAVQLGLATLGLGFLMLASAVRLASDTYKTFIYFQF